MRSKFKVLYHASSNREIEIFEPRKEQFRDKNEGPVIFATEDKSLASCFLVRTDDSWTRIGRFTENGVTTPWHFVTNSKRKFLKRDNGGAIYSLPARTFNNDSQRGMGSTEWVSRESVEPLDKEIFNSGLEAMKSLGVNVFFVNKRIFREIDKSEDHGKKIIEGLTKE